MIRRAYLAGISLSVFPLLGGCLNDGQENDQDDGTSDGSTTADTTCIEEIGFDIVFVTEYGDWKESDVPVVAVSDERIADLSSFREILTNAVESDDYSSYEYGGREFRSFSYYEKVDEIPDAEALEETISELPSGDIPDVPPGPYVRKEDEYVSVRIETLESCPE